MLQSMTSKTVGYDLVTKQQQQQRRGCSVSQSCLTLLSDPMYCHTPGFPAKKFKKKNNEDS